MKYCILFLAFSHVSFGFPQVGGLSGGPPIQFSPYEVTKTTTGTSTELNTTTSTRFEPPRRGIHSSVGDFHPSHPEPHEDRNFDDDDDDKTSGSLTTTSKVNSGSNIFRRSFDDEHPTRRVTETTTVGWKTTPTDKTTTSSSKRPF